MEFSRCPADGLIHADTACFRPRIAGVPEEPLKPAPGGKNFGEKSVKVSHLCPSTTKASATFIFLRRILAQAIQWSLSGHWPEARLGAGVPGSSSQAS